MFAGRLFAVGGQMQRRRAPAFAVVFRDGARRVTRVSLNRCEQRVFDYLQAHREERQFWQEKLRRLTRISADEYEAARQAEGELWRYYVERSAVAAPFKEAAQREGLARTSMRNLAELLIRLWTEPRPKKKAAAADS